jgi:hypothetical protein
MFLVQYKNHLWKVEVLFPIVAKTIKNITIVLEICQMLRFNIQVKVSFRSRIVWQHSEVTNNTVLKVEKRDSFLWIKRGDMKD